VTELRERIALTLNPNLRMLSDKARAEVYQLADDLIAEAAKWLREYPEERCQPEARWLADDLEGRG